PIRPNEYEAQVLTSLQPILAHIDSSTSTDKLSALSGKLPALYSQPSIPAAYPVRTPMSGLRGRRVSSLREALLRRFVHTAILAPLIARDTPVGLVVLARSLRPGSQDK